MSAESIKIEEVKHLKKMLEGSPACANKEDRAVYLDSELEGDYKRLCMIHEILEIWLQGRVKHSKIDLIAIDIIEGLRKIGEIE
jgi:hypothetical protein